MNKELLERYNALYTQEERKKMTAQMLSSFRKLNKLQQKEVAQLVGIKPQTYGAYESGRNETPIEILVRLSILYDVPVDILIQRDNMTKTQKSAIEQLDYFDEQLQGIREAMLKNGNEANEQFQTIIENIEKLTDVMRKASENLPNDETE
jgi:transcriptional regulator with XRE-family HTH domain